MPSDLSRLFRRSPAARAAWKIFQQLRDSGADHWRGMTIPAICWLLRDRFPKSTVSHECLTLARLGAIVRSGGPMRTRAGGWTWQWRAV
jgi:hypothetical protein